MVADDPVGRGASGPGHPPVAVAHHAEHYRPGRLIDVFRAPAAGGGPVVLLWHGSGPDEREVLAPLAGAVARLGLLVLVPDWRSDDPVLGPVELLDSIAFARSTSGALGGDPGRIVLAGWSLGANAAAAVAGRPGIAGGWHPAGLVGLAGSYDGSPFDGRRDAGGSVGGAGRPALVAHGTVDPVVPPTGSVSVAGQLAEAGWRVVLRQIETDHAGSIGTDYNPWRNRCAPTQDADRLAVLDSVARAVAAVALGPG